MKARQSICEIKDLSEPIHFPTDVFAWATGYHAPFMSRQLVGHLADAIQCAKRVYSIGPHGLVYAECVVQVQMAVHMGGCIYRICCVGIFGDFLSRVCKGCGICGLLLFHHNLGYVRTSGPVL